jgi:DNA-binding response OmpR family regulator
MTKKYTVLVIEDDVEILHFISRALELEGFTVYRAEDGATGLEIVRKDSVSLVLLDLRLPGPDGWSVLREMKRDPGLAAIPVVVLTAAAEASQRRRTLRMGADSYLVKPISAHDLVRAICDVLKGKAGAAVAPRTVSPAV